MRPQFLKGGTANLGEVCLKVLELKLNDSKVMLIQLSANSSDPEFHDHGDEFQLSIPLVGQSLVEHQQGVFQLDLSDRLVTAPFEKHRHFANEEAIRVLLINLKRPFLQRVLEDRLDRPVDVDFSLRASGSSDRFRRIAERLARHSFTDSQSPLAVEELEWDLADLLFSHHPGSHSAYWRETVALQQHPLLKRALEYISEYCANPLTIDELAEVTGLSKYHFIRLFHKELGETPSQFVTRCRLKRAQVFLTHTDMDITAIAFEVGFGSLSTFERLFKRAYGRTASEYRTEARQFHVARP